MANAHDLAVLRARGDDQLLRGDPNGGERVVAAGLDLAWESREDPLSVVPHQTRLPVQERLRPPDLAPEGLDDRLMTEADPEGGDVRDGDAGIFRTSRPG